MKFCFILDPLNSLYKIVNLGMRNRNTDFKLFCCKLHKLFPKGLITKVDHQIFYTIEG